MCVVRQTHQPSLNKKEERRERIKSSLRQSTGIRNPPQKIVGCE